MVRAVRTVLVMAIVALPLRASAQSALDGFNPGANSTILAAVVQSDGRVVLGGEFTSVGFGGGAIGRSHIARINASGSIDSSFNADANGAVRVIAEQPDGKLVIGGDFTDVGGFARQRIARLNADGSIDAGFNVAFNGQVNAVAIQSDGRIVVGGEFTAVGGVNRNRIARLSVSGSIFVGSATIGLSRPDVGAVLGAQFTSSGFQLQAPGLEPGTYRVGAYAHSTVSGTWNDSRFADITVVRPVSNPAMALDAPANGATVGSSFWIAGWAVDLGSFDSTGVDAIHVWAFPSQGSGFGPGVFVAAAGYGGPRPDVGAAFGQRFTNSGFGVQAGVLAPGGYRLIAYAHSTIAGTFNNSKYADIVVSGTGAVARDRGPERAYSFLLPADDSPEGVLAAGTSLWRSRAPDGSPGRWSIVKPYTPSGSPIDVVARQDRDVIWVGHASGEMYRTANARDAEPSWTHVNRPQTSGSVTSIAIDPVSASVAYVALEGGTLWKTTDAGQSWAEVVVPTTRGDNAEVHAVAVHPRERDVLHAGSRDAVFVSRDGGATWAQTAIDLRGASIAQLAYVDNHLVVVTPEFGLIAIPDPVAARQK